MRRLAALLVLCALAASCGRAGDVHVLAEQDLPADLYGDEDAGSVASREVGAVVYFVRLENDPSDSRLEPVRRAGTTDRTEAEFAMMQLLRGPNDADVAGGLRTAIPGRNPEGGDQAGTRLLGVSVDGDVAAVNLTGEFEGPAEDFVQILRIAQVVWTLTGLDGIERVRFLIHGVDQPVIDQDGTAHSTVSRARYSRLSPPAGEAEADPCPVAEDC